MIITTLKPYQEIKTQLKKQDKIGIVSCNACARMCRTGGDKVANKLAKRLTKDGFKIFDVKVYGAACDIDQMKKEKVKGDVIIILACDAATYNIKKLSKRKKIIPALNTVGLGAWDEKGNITLVRIFK